MKTPWTLDTSSWPFIINEGDRIVALLTWPSHYPDQGEAEVSDAEKAQIAADANLIINAVNAYDQKPAFVTLKTLPICDTHSRAKRTTPARCCHVCQRLVVEQEIAAMTVDALLAAGYRLNVNNGGQDDELKPTIDRQAVLDAMFQTDLEHLKVWNAGDRIKEGCTGWVFFVYGNSGYDVISDYTTNLEAVLAPVNAFTNTLD